MGLANHFALASEKTPSRKAVNSVNALAGCPGTEDCCAIHVTPSCSDSKCCASVCAIFPTCCTGEWKSACAETAASLCTCNDTCADGNLCTLDSGIPPACDSSPTPAGSLCNDGNLCTDEVCDGLGNCLSSPNTNLCDDGLDCTTGDVCSDSTCNGTEPAAPLIDLALVVLPSSTVTVGRSVVIDLIATSNTCSDETISGINAILTWNPNELSLTALLGGDVTWTIVGFPDDSSLDGLNDPYSDVPGNDGDAFFEGFSGFGQIVQIATTGTVVARFEFETLTASTSTLISLAPQLGTFTQSRVIGTGEFQGIGITGSLNAANLTLIPCQLDQDCDDSLFCNGEESCDAALGVCQPGIFPCTNGLACCEDADRCDLCTLGCECDNNRYCDGQETCDLSSGLCRAGTFPCQPGLGCCELGNLCGSCGENCPCDNGIYCDGEEVCSNGFCVSGPVPCTSGQACCEDAQTCDSCANAACSCVDRFDCTVSTCIEGSCEFDDSTCSGSCCFSDGSFRDQTTFEECQQLAGTYIGHETTCIGDPDHDFCVCCGDLCPYNPNKCDPGVCGCDELELDTDGDTTPDCIDVCPDAAATNTNCENGCPASQPFQNPEDVITNRFLSIRNGSLPGMITAIRVNLVDLPIPFVTLNGQYLWVGEPIEICENSGQNAETPLEECALIFGDLPDQPGSTLIIAPLQCQPHFMDWSTLNRQINVFSEFIIPSGTYAIQAVESSCPLTEELSFSDSLVITNSGFGDLVGLECTSATSCSPPDNSVDVPTDVTAVLEMFQNSRFAPGKVRTEIEPARIDFKINFTDITLVLDAFRNVPYPFEPSTTNPCPK